MNNTIYKLLVLATILFGASSDLNGQNVLVGIPIGPSISNFRKNVEFDNNFGNRIGYCISGSFETKLKKEIWLETRLTYETKGGRVSRLGLLDTLTGNFATELTLHLNYQYLTLPVILKYKFISSSNPFDFAIGAGMYGALLVGRADQISGYSFETIIENKLSLGARRTDFGALVSLDCNYSINRRYSISASLLGDYGFLNVADKPKYNGLFKVDDYAKNVSGKLNLGVKYRLGSIKPKERKRIL